MCIRDRFVAGPLHEAEGILYAEIDVKALEGQRWMLDVAGHYARPDVFQLHVQREAKAVLRERAWRDPLAGTESRSNSARAAAAASMAKSKASSSKAPKPRAKRAPKPKRK